MNDGAGLGADISPGMNLCHHIMPEGFFIFCGFFVVDILQVGLHFGDLFLRNSHAHGFFGFCQSNPQLVEGGEFHIFRKKILHFFSRIAGRKRADVAVVIHFLSSHK